MNIAVREGHELVTLPEGASYLGFIFSTAETPEEVEIALRGAFQELTIVIDPLWKIAGDVPAISSLSTIPDTRDS